MRRIWNSLQQHLMVSSDLSYVAVIIHALISVRKGLTYCLTDLILSIYRPLQSLTAPPHSQFKSVLHDPESLNPQPQGKIQLSIQDALFYTVFQVVLWSLPRTDP